MAEAFFLTMDSAALKVAAEIPIWEGVSMAEAFFLTMDSAALKVAAEIPIWEMGKRTLKSEAISCPTTGFHVRL